MRLSCWGGAKLIHHPRIHAHQTEPELLNTGLQLLTKQGHQGFGAGIRLLVEEAMRRKRGAVLQAQPYERTPARQGQANGFKPKTLTTRIGAITFQVPQVRPPLVLRLCF